MINNSIAVRVHILLDGLDHRGVPFLLLQKDFGNLPMKFAALNIALL